MGVARLAMVERCTEFVENLCYCKTRNTPPMLQLVFVITVIIQFNEAVQKTPLIPGWSADILESPTDDVGRDSLEQLVCKSS